MILSWFTRDLVMFLVGMGAFLHEVLVASTERPFIISAACALMGLPFVLHAGMKAKQREGNGE